MIVSFAAGDDIVCYFCREWLPSSLVTARTIDEVHWVFLRDTNGLVLVEAGDYTEYNSVSLAASCRYMYNTYTSTTSFLPYVSPPASGPTMY